MEARAQATGSCACGDVRFACPLPPRFVAHCHCANCRRVHGAPAVTWAGFPRDQWHLVTGGERLLRWTSPAGSTWTACGRCGSRLAYESPRWADEVHVAVAAFDEDLGVPPAAHVHADDAPRWAPITDRLPRRGGASGVEPLDDGGGADHLAETEAPDEEAAS